MILLFLSLLCADGAAPGDDLALKVPGFFQRPAASWEDLDGDGKLDIVIYDRELDREDRDRLLVWYAANPVDTFTELTYQPIDHPVSPAGPAEHPFVTADAEAFSLRFDGTWRVIPPPAGVRLRPGLEPIQGPTGRLLPTFDGYLLEEGECLTQFKVAPSIKLKAHAMTLIWPVPEFVELNGDGLMDLQTAPTQYVATQQIRRWRALRTPSGWTQSWIQSSFPENLVLVSHQQGDLNHDGLSDLVIQARPKKNFSIFEEMSLVIYLGQEDGGWSPRPHQVIQSKQNLWQTGPVEITDKGVFFYYYKGLIRSHFKMDRYRWNEAGFLDPKPESQKWTLKDADKDEIWMEGDMNGDGLPDLILEDSEGFMAFPRRASWSDFPYQNQPVRLGQDLPPDEDGDSRHVRIAHLRGLYDAALVVEKGTAHMWWFEEDMAGNLSLHRR